MRGKVVSYMLIGGTVQIGSAPDCEIRFSDDLISAHHASINKRADGSCWIRDLKSRNGTYVNHQELTSSSERMLKDNDLISIADVDMTFWDGRVVHESFRFVYALLTLVVTVILCVVGYMVYQQFRPVSVYFIQSAGTEARNGDFVKAKQYLTEAKEAKNASDMTNEIRALSKKVDVWERS